MRRLIVNPGTEMAWDIPLEDASIRLGRDAENTVVIDDPSISGAHCELTVWDNEVLIKDLGSANGIRVDGELVNQLELQPGQVFQLGDVTLQYEVSAAKGAALSGPMLAANLRCKIHSRNPASYFCTKCDRAYCQLCVSPRNVEGRIIRVCRDCGTECVPVEQPQDEIEIKAPYFKQLVGAFGYPFRGDGIYVLVLGTFLFVLLEFASRFAFLFIGGIMLTVFSGGYMAAFMKEIIKATANGDDEAPDWPEVSSFASDVAAPFFQMLGTTLFSFLPVIVMSIFIATQSSATDSAPTYGWIQFGLILLGCFYFPMAFLGVAMFDSVAAVNPILVVPSIARIFRDYVIVVLVLGVAITLRYVTVLIIDRLIKVWILPDMIVVFVGLYLVMVQMRMLGLLYRHRREELGWFRR